MSESRRAKSRKISRVYSPKISFILFLISEQLTWRKNCGVRRACTISIISAECNWRASRAPVSRSVSPNASLSASIGSISCLSDARLTASVRNRVQMMTVALLRVSIDCRRTVSQRDKVRRKCVWKSVSPSACDIKL